MNHKKFWGYLLIVCGFIGIVLPIIPGIITIVIGYSLIKDTTKQKYKILNNKNTIKSCEVYDEKDFHLSLLNEIKKGSNVLSVGCGSGREVKRLLELGCEVTAVDIDKKMLNKSKKKNPSAKHHLIDIRDFENKDNYDYILLFFNTINYFENKEERKELISKLFLMLKTDGRIIITTKHLSTLRQLYNNFKLGFMYYYPFFETNHWVKDLYFRKIKKRKINNSLVMEVIRIS